MTLFVCSSIYQLMNAILIKLDSGSETADIIFIKSLEHIIDVNAFSQRIVRNLPNKNENYKHYRRN